MKKTLFKTIVSSLLVLTMAATMCPMDSDVSAAQKTTKKAAIKTKTLTITKGKTKKITIKNKQKKHTYTFKSANKKVATVTKKGVVKGIKKGKTTITVYDKYKIGKKTKTRKMGKVKVNIVEKIAL